MFTRSRHGSADRVPTRSGTGRPQPGLSEIAVSQAVIPREIAARGGSMRRRAARPGPMWVGEEPARRVNMSDGPRAGKENTPSNQAGETRWILSGGRAPEWDTPSSHAGEGH